MSTGIQVINEKQQLPAIYKQRSQDLLKIISSNNAVAISKMSAEIMPNGNPDFEGMRLYPSIKQFITTEKEGHFQACVILISMIDNFCKEMNVQRGMTVDQAKRCAASLVESCDNYRFEDYFTMFQMAQNNRFGKLVYERIDSQVIFSIRDAYDDLRFREGQRILAEKEQERLKMIEEDRLKRLESETVIDIDFGEIVNSLKETREKIYQEGLERKKERNRLAKESYKKQREDYARQHNIDINKISQTTKTKIDKNDIDFIENCFTPKNKK